MKNQMKKNRNLLSVLLSLLVIVANLALLVWVTVPNLNRSHLKEKASACQEDLLFMAVAIDQWAAEHNPGDTVTLADLQPYLKSDGAAAALQHRQLLAGLLLQQFPGAQHCR